MMKSFCYLPAFDGKCLLQSTRRRTEGVLIKHQTTHVETTFCFVYSLIH